MSISNSQIESWSASLSLRGGCSAEMTISEGTGDLASTTTLGETYELWADINAVPVPVFRGIVTDINVDSSANDPAYKYSVSLQSFASSLARKPVNTETFGAESGGPTGKAILDAVAIKYGAMSTSDFDFTDLADTTFSPAFITLVGDSMVHTFREFANACNCDLYVDHDGKLKATAYTTSGSPITIEKSDTIKVSKSVTNLDGFSCIRVRGRYKSLDELGTSMWYNKNISFTTQGAISQFTTTIATQATREEVRAADWGTDETGAGGVSAWVSNVTDSGRVTIRFTKSGTPWPGSSTISFNVQATGPVNWYVERDSLSLQTIQNIKPRAEMANQSHIDSSGIRQGFVNWAWHSQKEADAKEESRIDIVGFCTGLITDLGIRWYEIDNIYIPDIAAAKLVGCRKIQEFLMSRQVFSVEVSWDGTYGLNDCVTFYDPFSDGMVIGLISQIEISWDLASADFTANLTVELFDSTTCATCSYDT